MASIVPGYEYDIFISYRHNDNRSGWVTKFVSSLQEELAATIKEPVSVYFDTNPYDGLLETHNVDKSLEGKLKSLIFIPIISQTYCDPKSFAWQHEFVTFNEFSVKDKLGRDIKLSNGNVASRILPVKIHDLDSEDNHLLEKELGGVLRCIEFIFKSPGVNRPLSANENHPNDNLNLTYYKDQVNKAANAIKEIITGIQNPDPKSMSISDRKTPRPATLQTKNRKPLIATISSILLLLLVGYFLYPKIFKSSMLTEPDKSIAVLPFVNMSADPDQEYFSDGLSEELLNLLAKIPDLKVIGRTSSFYFKGKNEDLRIIGEKLGVSYLLEGSVRKSGNTIRITAQLIQSADGSHLWSETYDRQLVEVFAVQDEIATQVVSQLKISIPGLVRATVSKNLEAYNLLLESKYIGQQRVPGYREKRIQLMEQAVLLDSTDTRIWAELANTYLGKAWDSNTNERQDLGEKSMQAAIKAIQIDDRNAEGHYVLGGIYRSLLWDWKKAEQELRKAEDLSIEYQGAMRPLYFTLGNWEKAVESDKINLDQDPLVPRNWRNLGLTYMVSCEYDKAIQNFRRALELSPGYDEPRILLAGIFRRQGKIDQAISELDSIRERDNNSISVRMLSEYCQVYWQIGDSVKSNTYLQQLIDTDNNNTDNSGELATIYAQRKNADLTFKWLQKAYDRRNPALSLIKSFSYIKELRDPRFNEFLAKMNLPIEN